MGRVKDMMASYGEIEAKPLSRLQQVAAQHLTKSWANIPHVTHFCDIDVSLAEDFRKSLIATDGKKITITHFFAKATARALTAFPVFNSSLDEDGSSLVIRKYCNIGFVIDTANGLVVGVIKDIENKPLTTVADELTSLSEDAKRRGLPVSKMEGGCFTISALGRLGGTGFTPIINAPQVAILALSETYDKPIKSNDLSVEWRKVIPISLSYDHRVINGSDAGRFLSHIAQSLATPDQLL